MHTPTHMQHAHSKLFVSFLELFAPLFFFKFSSCVGFDLACTGVHVQKIEATAATGDIYIHVHWFLYNLVIQFVLTAALVCIAEKAGGTFNAVEMMKEELRVSEKDDLF